MLQALRETGLTMRLEKCKFFIPVVQFLGFKVSRDGIQPGSRKVEAISKFAQPEDVHAVRRFIGMTSFFRRFIRNYARIASPLTALTKQGVEFKWTNECQEAFDKMKSELVKEPILVRFVPGRPTELHTDASHSGLGAMLFQVDDGKKRLVYAISRKLSNSELNYHSTKLEQLAAVWAMTRLRHYLYGEHFKLVSDCNAVAALRSKSGETPQLARWLNQLAEFDFTVEHKPGTSMQHVDALSRDPVEEGVEEKEENLPTDRTGKRVLAIRVDDENAHRMIQAVDEEVREKINILSKPPQERTQKEKTRVSGFEVRQGMLFKKEKDRRLFVVPAASRKYITLLAHDKTGHFGIDKTIEAIRRLYWFPKMREYVTFHIKACIDCLFNKEHTGKKEGILNPFRPPKRPFARIFIDHVGPLIKSHGKAHIIVMVDGLTKYVILRAVKSTSAKGVIKFLEQVFLEYGDPETLVSDQGTAYTAKETDEFLGRHGVTHAKVSVQRPQANEQCERFNKEVARLLRSSCKTEYCHDWERHVPLAQVLINRVVSRSAGKAPFEILHGYLPRLNAFAQVIEKEQDNVWQPAATIQELIRENLLKSQNQYAYYYDRKRRPHFVRFAIGDIVVVSRLPVHTGQPVKFQPKFRGPMIITETGATLTGCCSWVANIPPAQPIVHSFVGTIPGSQGE